MEKTRKLIQWQSMPFTIFVYLTNLMVGWYHRMKVILEIKNEPFLSEFASHACLVCNQRVCSYADKCSRELLVSLSTCQVFCWSSLLPGNPCQIAWRISEWGSCRGVCCCACVCVCVSANRDYCCHPWGFIRCYTPLIYKQTCSWHKVDL